MQGVRRQRTWNNNSFTKRNNLISRLFLCEVLIEGKRCGKFIPFEEVRYINFLHKATRNGKSDAWILDPKNIGFGCASHHIEEERSGVRMKFQEYNEDGELQYILEY